MASEGKGLFEEFRVAANELAAQIEKLPHEGNLRRIFVKKDGNTIMEVPLTLAAIGVIEAPALAAIGGLAGLVGKYTIAVERRE